MNRFCFWDLLPTQSRRPKFFKPCGRTTQFSTELHCQARNQRRTELVRGYLSSRGSQYYLLSYSFLELSWLASEVRRRATVQLRASCFLHQLRSVKLLNMLVGRNSIICWRAPKILWAALMLRSCSKNFGIFLYHGMGVGAGWVNEMLKEGYYILQRWNKRQVHAESSLIISNPE